MAPLRKTVLFATLVLATPGCGGPTAVRGEEVEGLDQEAMSTSLDRHDLQKMLHEVMTAMQNAPIVQRWQSQNRPTVAVLPIRNETSEHLDSGLNALISDIETTLINAGHVRVISHENQAALIDEVRRQQTGAYDQRQVAEWGRQVGARYFVTGKIFSVDERQRDERRVQYSLFLQVIEAETGDILFQHRSSVTKALIN